MLNLLKADLLRITKDKLFRILVIIVAAVGVVFPLIYLALFSFIVEDGMTVRDMVSAFDVALTAFAPFSNIGLVLAILLSITLAKDMSNGTLRNKVIVGKSRFQIYLSNVLSSLIIILGVVVGYALINFMVSCCFFHVGITQANVWKKLGTVLLQILGWSVLSLAMTFFSVSMKNMGGAVVCYVVPGLVLTFVGSIMSSVVMMLDPATSKTAIDILNALCMINIPHTMGSTFAGGIYSILGIELTTLTATSVIEYVLSCLVFGSAFAVGGYFIFKNKDLK